MILKKDMSFIQRAFAGKRDLSGLPSWRHVLNAATYLERIGIRYKEINAKKLEGLVRATLGHDLLEDTHTSKKEIERMWGRPVLRYITAMTNTRGDQDMRNYIRHLSTADEEVLLIKFADIYANVSNSVRRFRRLDPTWINTFWYPLLIRYRDELFQRPFDLYPKTADRIIRDIRHAMHRLEQKRKTH